MEGPNFDSSDNNDYDNDDNHDNSQGWAEADANEEEKEKAVEEENASGEEEKEKDDDKEKHIRKYNQWRYGIERFLKDGTAVEVVTALLEAINRLMTELQGVVCTEAARDREDGAGLMCDYNGSIHTKYGALHIKYGDLHLHNEDGVLPTDAIATAGLVHIANINGAIDFTLSYLTPIISSQW